MPFYQKGDVRIRYEEAGSGFPLLVTPGGGLNSRVKNWPTAVINAMEAFKNDFRCITMDQRNANEGESTGPLAIDDPWGGFAGRSHRAAVNLSQVVCLTDYDRVVTENGVRHGDMKMESRQHVANQVLVATHGEWRTPETLVDHPRIGPDEVARTE